MLFLKNRIDFVIVKRQKSLFRSTLERIVLNHGPISSRSHHTILRESHRLHFFTLKSRSSRFFPQNKAKENLVVFAE